MLPRTSQSRAILSLLLGLTLLVGWSRTLGLDALLPQQHEPDPYCVFQAQFLQARAAGEVETVEEYFGEQGVRFFYYYPLHLARLWLLGGPSEPAKPRLDASTLEQHLTAASEPYQRSRRWSAALSALIVPAVFLLARRFLGPWSALLAAALAGTSLLHLVAAGQAKPHAIAASATAIGLWGATLMRRRPDLRGLAGGGLCLALGVCALHNGLILIAAGVAAFFLRDREGGRGGRALWLLPVILLAGVYLWSSPGFLVPPPPDSQQSYEGFRFEDGAFIGLGHRIDLSLFSLSHPWRWLSWLWGNDPALLVLALLGIVSALMARRGADPARRRDALVLLAHGLPYMLVLLVYEKTFDRYALPLLPHLSVLGAAAVTWATGALARRLPRARALIAAVAGAAALSVPVLGQAALLRLRLRPDTYELTARWLREKVPPHEVIGTGPGMVLPVIVHPSDLQALHAAWTQNPWLHYLASLDADRAATNGRRITALRLRDPGAARALSQPATAREWLREQGVQYVILENSQRSRALKPVFMNLREALRAEARLMLRFNPRAGRQLKFLDFGDQPQMLVRTLDQQRLGPPIEIWRLR